MLEPVQSGEMRSRLLYINVDKTMTFMRYFLVLWTGGGSWDSAHKAPVRPTDKAYSIAYNKVSIWGDSLTERDEEWGEEVGGN